MRLGKSGRNGPKIKTAHVRLGPNGRRGLMQTEFLDGQISVAGVLPVGVGIKGIQRLSVFKRLLNVYQTDNRMRPSYLRIGGPFSP